MKSKYDYDIIRDYLHGLVDQETAARIRELIRTDEVAKNIATGILQLEHEFKGNEQEIEAYIESLRQKQLTLIAGESKVRKMTFPWVRVAAAILLLAVVTPILWLTLYRNDPNDILASELRSPYPLSAVGRGPIEDNPAYEAYLSGHYNNAIKAFEAREGDVTDTFYNGLSNLYAGHYDRAIELLSSESIGTSRYKEQALWFRSLALIKAERISEARESLQQISSQKQHYKSEQASILLKDLN